MKTVWQLEAMINGLDISPPVLPYIPPKAAKKRKTKRSTKTKS